MKRILTIFLTICVCLSSFTCFAASVDTSNDEIPDRDFDFVMKVLKYIGVVEGELSDERLSEVITRYEFATYMAKALKCDEITPSKKYYVDTDGERLFDSLADMKVLNPPADGLFEPDRSITFAEACIMAVRATGYEKLMSVIYGTDEWSYIRIAKDLDIASGAIGVTKISRRDALRIIFNMMNTGVCDFEPINSNDGYSRYPIENQENAADLMEMVHNLNYAEGTVTANYITGIMGMDATDEDKIAVESKVYDCSVAGAEQFVGKRVKIYWSDANPDKANIVLIHCDNEKALTITSENLVGYKNGKVVYADNGRERSVSFDAKGTIIYNGVRSGKFLKDLFDIEYGDVTLYENENGDYDIAVVNSYKMVTVVKNDTDSRTAYTKDTNGKQVKIDFKKPHDVYSAESGAVLSSNNITDEDVLIIGTAEDGSYTRVYAADVWYKQTIQNKIQKSNGLTTVTVNGAEYKVSEHYAGPSLDIGVSYNLYIDGYGCIVSAVAGSSTDSVKIGYVYDWKDVDEAFQSEFRLLIFNEDGEHLNAELKNRLKLDGNTVTDTEAKTKLNKKQLITYRLNKKGELVSVDTVATDAESRNGDASRLYQGVEKSTYRWLSSYRMLVRSTNPDNDVTKNIMPLDSNTKIITVPSTASASEKEQFSAYTLGTDINQLFGSYELETFKTNPEYASAEVVLVYETDVKWDGNVRPYYMLVEEVETVLGYDGDEKVKITGWVHNLKSSVLVSSNCVTNKLVRKTDSGSYSGVGVETFDPAMIGSGDIIRYMTDNMNEAALLELTRDYSDGEAANVPDDWKCGELIWDGGTTKNQYMWNGEAVDAAIGKFWGNGIFCGEATYIQKNKLGSEMLIGIGLNGETRYNYNILSNKAVVLVYDSSIRDGNKIRKGTLGDITTREYAGDDCDNLFINEISTGLQVIIVFK